MATISYIDNGVEKRIKVPQELANAAKALRDDNKSLRATLRELVRVAPSKYTSGEWSDKYYDDWHDALAAADELL